MRPGQISTKLGKSDRNLKLVVDNLVKSDLALMHAVHTFGEMTNVRYEVRKLRAAMLPSRREVEQRLLQH